MIFEELQKILDGIILDMLEDDEIEIRSMPFVPREESIKMKKELWHRFKKSKEYKDLWEDDWLTILIFISGDHPKICVNRK